MGAKKPSILTRVIAMTAERLAMDPRIPPENRIAFRSAAEQVMHGQWADLYGGEQIRISIYVARNNTAARAARRHRILLSLAAGQTPGDIARAEGVSRRWVEKLRELANRSGMDSSLRSAE